MANRLGLLSAVAVVSALVVAISGCSTNPLSADPGEVFGYVLNALTADPIEGASVTVDGEVTVSDSLGYYIDEEVDTGVVTVEASADGFVTVSPVVDVDEAESVRQDCVLLPDTTGDEYRIVLTWGANPDDLDSHLWVPTGGGAYTHVYFGNAGSVTSEPYAKLEIDGLAGYGPEAMTVFPEHAGLYTYAVYHFFGTGTLQSSQAVVRIYEGNDLLHTLTVPGHACEANWWWNVFTFDAQSGDFTIVNTFQANAPAPTAPMAK